MGVVDFSQYVSELIEAGEVVEGNVVRIVADNGTQIGEAVQTTVSGGNGVAAEVSAATQAGTGGAIATGFAYLATPVSVAGTAIGVALGLTAGYGLYSLSPSFWEDLDYKLYQAGKTIGGKVITYWNGENLYIDEETIEIFKNAFYAAQLFVNEYEQPEYQDTGLVTITSRTSPIEMLPYAIGLTRGLDISATSNAIYSFINENYTNNKICTIRIYTGADEYSGWSPLTIWISDDELSEVILGHQYPGKTFQTEGRGHVGEPVILTGSYQIIDNSPPIFEGTNDLGNAKDISNINATSYTSQYAQPGAILPDENPFPLTYPTWYPHEYPQTLPDPAELPTVYPLKYPTVDPNAQNDQSEAQNPDPEPAPVIYPNILPDFPLPQPNPVYEPAPEPVPDPDPQPVPDPLPTPESPAITPDPANPNPDPTPSPIIPVPGLPTTVSSSHLFTVYNPTSSQLDALGAYLWDSSLIAALRDIWQDPLDGIISLIQVYATPATSGNHNIILGFLDSGVSSAVVSNQFTSIDCGTVTVPENKQNATDYAPYTSLHLYLPFIGIVELDTNECMNSSINVKYKVDVYTGTCLATVAITRAEDMPNGPILYTYSGNCSQQLPLTSGNATGVLSALIGGITAGLSVASGGGLGVVAGAHIAGQSLTHEMFHVSHSGNISANAGIMGQKKPYLIIGRRHNYDANNYNSLYGFPANKTITIGNHTGYLKVKTCFLKTSATQPEHDEIMSLLQDGVII